MVAERVRSLARRQNGAVTRAQLLAVGSTPAQIKTWRSQRRLHRIHRGVYLLGDPLLLALGRESGALLAVGEGAALSHRSAAAIWGLTQRNQSMVDVSVPRNVRPRRGIRLHLVSALDRRDLTARSNLCVTTPARTVVDFAAAAATGELERALAEARALRLINDQKLGASLERASANHPGAARVRALLRTETGRALTRSQRERRMLELIGRAQLPKPAVNVKVRGFEVDLYWPLYKLVVEFDGYTTHGTRPKFESDRRRDQILAAGGIGTMRVTDLQLRTEPIAVMTRIGQAIAVRS